MADMELLKKLSMARGISGHEESVRTLIQREVSHYADKTVVDSMGNLLIFKKGKERAKTKLMLSAHMDEVGFIVNYITEDGFLKFASVGGIDCRVICGKSVTVGENALPGVVGAKPIHLLKSEEKDKSVPIEELYIDIGAKDKEEALQYVQLGDMICFDAVFDTSEGMIKGKALDDRAGCAVLVEMIQSELPYDMYFTFVVQEEIGLRGAKTAAYALDPQACIVVEATTAADIAGVDDAKQVCHLGKGAVISFMDRSTIYDKEYYKLAFQAAEAVGASCQAKQAVAGGNDAGAIHQSRSGIRTIAVSLPCRYLHSAVSMIAQDDLFAVQKMVMEMAKRIAGADNT